MLRFSIFGFPVTVEPWFWLATALLGMGQATGLYGLLVVLIWIFVSFVSILWHELGHAFLQRRFGGRQINIRLHAMGGYAASDGDYTRQESRLISLAGPVAGLILGAVTWWAARTFDTRSELVHGFLWSMIYLNIFWSLVNLLPILPMDGGRVLEASVDKPRRWLHQVSFVCAIVAGVALFAYFHSLFFLVFFGYMAYRNYVGMQSAFGEWSPHVWPGAEEQSFREKRAKPTAKQKYQPKIKPRAELDREHPAVVEIDALLDKISREGFGSLTDDEKKALDRASSELKDKDKRL